MVFGDREFGGQVVDALDQHRVLAGDSHLGEPVVVLPKLHDRRAFDLAVEVVIALDGLRPPVRRQGRHPWAAGGGIVMAGNVLAAQHLLHQRMAGILAEVVEQFAHLFDACPEPLDQACECQALGDLLFERALNVVLFLDAAVGHHVGEDVLERNERPQRPFLARRRLLGHLRHHRNPGHDIVGYRIASLRYSKVGRSSLPIRVVLW